MKNLRTNLPGRCFPLAMSWAFAALMAAATLSCNGKIDDITPDKNDDTDGEVAVESVSLSESKITIPMGKTYELTASVKPANAANKDVIWVSADRSIATVSNGVVTGIKDGKTTVKAVTVDGNFTAECAVTVATILPEKLWLDPPSATIAVGETWNYNIRVEPNDSNIAMEVVSSNSDIIEISPENRSVKGIKEGVATFTIRTIDGSSQTKGWVKVVDKRVFPTEAAFLLDQDYAVGTTVRVNSTSTSGLPRIEWTPAQANDRDFDLSSEDESIVLVEPDGWNSYKVSFLKTGATRLIFWSYIYETSTSFRKDADIHVHDGKPSFSYDYSDLTFWMGNTLYLIPNGLSCKLDMKYENIYDRNYQVTNASEFAEYITLSSGRVSAKKVGNTRIALRARSNPSQTLNIPVKVVNPPTGLKTSLTSNSIEMKKGTEQTIWLYTQPETTVGRFNISASGYVTATLKPGLHETPPFTPMPDNFKTLTIKAGNTTGTFSVTVTHMDNASVSQTITVKVTN